ncbi:MAG: hypothetical protein M1517_06665 [Deltaproteobacteria bacterium]|nr:hypothetical protein [Deltaproteobacteria bacterium]
MRKPIYITEKSGRRLGRHLVYNGTQYRKLKHVLDAVETATPGQAVSKTSSKSEAIQLLGLSRRTFYHKIKKIRSLSV